MTDEAMSEAVEAIKHAWDIQPDVNELDLALDPDLMLTNAVEAALRALLEPRVTPCETCSEGWVTHANGEHDRCPAGCDWGQVARPSLAILRGDLERVGCRDLDGSLWPLNVEPFDSSEPLYRIASEEVEST